MTGTKEERLSEIDRLYPRWDANTLWTMFQRCCARDPQADFIVSDDVAYSYGQSLENITATAKSLVASGVKKGTHVALLMRNCPEYIFLTFALARLGAVKIAVNPCLGRSELEFVLSHADAELLIAGLAVDETLQAAVPSLRTVVAPDRGERPARLSWAAFKDSAGTVPDTLLAGLTRGGEDADEVFDITFTSGSTAMPKGVMLTHDMLLRTAYGSCVSRLFEPGRRICVPVPLYHNLGYVEGVLAAMLVGGAVIISTEKVTAAKLLSMIRDRGANDLLTVPTQIIDFMENSAADEASLKTLHAVYSSAGTSPDWVWGEIRRKLYVSDVITAFGMTEVTASTMQTKPDDPEEYVIKYVGTIKPGGVAGLAEYHGFQCEYKVIDLNTGETLPPESAGELCCRGKTVMKGYYRQPEINAQIFDAEGWYHTRDIGILHENGYCTFLGRNNDSYKINGELVSPQFVDRVISRCPCVREVEVVGVQHPKCGAIGVAFVDAADQEESTKQSVLRYCRTHLAAFQVPRYFVFSSLDEWPKTSTGKVQKYKLRQIAQERLNAGEVWSGKAAPAGNAG